MKRGANAMKCTYIHCEQSIIDGIGFWDWLAGSHDLAFTTWKMIKRLSLIWFLVWANHPPMLGHFAERYRVLPP
jgi:hypothetical protein